MSTEEADFVVKKYDTLFAALESYESNLFNSWSMNIVDESEANLNKPLLIRENDLLKVNFDPKVVALLREVKYLGALAVNAPTTAANIYSKSETFRKYIVSLDHITRQYNNIRTGVLDVERPLIESKINEIDSQIEQALSSFSWKSDGVDDYITMIGGTVGELSSTLQAIKNNIGQIQKFLKGWSAAPLIERKDSKKSLSIDEKEAKVQAIFESIKKDGQLIHGLVKQTQELVKADDTSDKWINYRNYADEIVSKGYKLAMQTSLEYLVANMELSKSGDSNPLLECKLELENETLQFSPSMDEELPGNLIAIIQEFVDDIYHMAALIPRISPRAAPMLTVSSNAPNVEESNSTEAAILANGSTDQMSASVKASKTELAGYDDKNETYMGEMMNNEFLNKLRDTILQRARTIVEKALAYKEGYEQYAYLWTVFLIFNFLGKSSNVYAKLYFFFKRKRGRRNKERDSKSAYSA
jgi:dynein heavy chain